jgi:hypothetical protein
MRVHVGIRAIRRILAHTAFDIGPDLIVREAHDIKAHSLQVACPIAITDLAFMLSPVEFDDELCFEETKSAM